MCMSVGVCVCVCMSVLLHLLNAEAGKQQKEP